MKKPFTAPTLTPLGTITEMTGTWGDKKKKKDWCLDFGKDKGLGYPSDQFWKFIPICEPDDNGVS